MKKGPPALLVGAVVVWIAFDVGRGAMQGIAEVDQRRLDETPVTEIARETAARFNEMRDTEWTPHSVLRSVTASGDKIIFRLVLTDEVDKRVGARVTQAERADIRNKAHDEGCRHKDLKYVQARGGEVLFAISRQDGSAFVEASKGRMHC